MFRIFLLVEMGYCAEIILFRFSGMVIFLVDFLGNEDIIVEKNVTVLRKKRFTDSYSSKI